jgi:vacuolar-type H+-ATPase subunit E/Vma4
MQTTLLAVLIVIISLALVVLILVIGLYIRRFNSVTREIAESVREVAEAFRTTRDAIVPLAEDMRSVLANLDGLISSTRKDVESVGRAMEFVEHFIEGRAISTAAGKAVAASKSILSAVFEGLKEGLKAIRSRPKENKEESGNE